VRIVAVDSPGVGPWDELAAVADRHGADLQVLPRPGFEAAPPPCEGLVVSDAKLTASVIERLGPCRFVVAFGTGTDWIDLEAADRHGMLVANTPLANVEDVATHALAMILALERRLVRGDALVRACDFDIERLRPLHRLGDRRVGMLSFGNIPRRLAELLRPFGARLLAHDPFVAEREMRERGVDPVGLDELLRSSDVLSVHAPLTPETAGLLDERRLALLPRGALVVVTGRGGTYDPDALADRLHSGELAGAALDVFPEEPLPSQSRLLAAPNSLLSPHVGGYSEGALRDYHRAVAEAVDAFLSGRAPAHPVNTEAGGGQPFPTP
jgi:D-3-phosphoglycerate dehydrogenase / 2-oxoglutarate reductase